MLCSVFLLLGSSADLGSSVHFPTSTTEGLGWGNYVNPNGQFTLPFAQTPYTPDTESNPFSQVTPGKDLTLPCTHTIHC